MPRREHDSPNASGLSSAPVRDHHLTHHHSVAVARVLLLLVVVVVVVVWTTDEEEDKDLDLDLVDRGSRMCGGA